MNKSGKWTRVENTQEGKMNKEGIWTRVENEQRMENEQDLKMNIMNKNEQWRIKWTECTKYKWTIMNKVIMNKNEHNEQSDNEQKWKMNKIWMNKNY